MNSPLIYKNKLTFIALILLIIYLTISIIKLLNIHILLVKLLIIVSPILGGYVFAYLLNPLYKSINNKLNNKASLIITILIYILGLTTILILITPSIIKNLNILLKSNNKYIKLVTTYLKINYKSCLTYVKYISYFGLTNLFGFYFLYKFNHINRFILKKIDKKYYRLINLININMKNYLKGLLIDTLILFFITFILFLIIGLKESFLFAFIISITNVIPFIGPYIGGALAFASALMEGKTLALITLFVVIIVQLLESNIINPIIMSKSIKINPFIILFSVISAGYLFGPVAMILTMPILIVIKCILIVKEKDYDKNF